MYECINLLLSSLDALFNLMHVPASESPYFIIFDRSTLGTVRSYNSSVFTHLLYTAYNNLLYTAYSNLFNLIKWRIAYCETERSWYKRSYFDISLKVMRKTTEILIQDVRCAGIDSNCAPPQLQLRDVTDWANVLRLSVSPGNSPTPNLLSLLCVAGNMGKILSGCGQN